MEDNSQPDFFILSGSSDGSSLRSQHSMSGHGTLKQEDKLAMHRAPGTIGMTFVITNVKEKSQFFRSYTGCVGNRKEWKVEERREKI